jgi:hypothetical protein
VIGEKPVARLVPSFALFPDVPSLPGSLAFLAFSTGLGIGLLTGGYDELFSVCPVPSDGGTY